METERDLGQFKMFCGRLRDQGSDIMKSTMKLGEDDPKRIIHSLKVGLAVSLVSLFYYFKPLYDGFGVSAMWAVITVVVVFEFSVGGTLGRGLNRALATFLAGTLGFGAHHLALLSGNKGEPIVLGIFVFLAATLVTFIRFFPKIKATYDYGMLVFILTFCLISVSGYRDDEILDMAHKRVSTILIGAFIAASVCILICPVWAGEELHILIAINIDKLGNSLEAFGKTSLKIAGNRDSSKKPLQGYNGVLNTKQNEENLACLARWEPRHGQFRFRHPWKQYLKIGSLTRHCAYRIDSLHGHLHSKIHVQGEIGRKIDEACMKTSSELGKALKELASAIKTWTLPHVSNVPMTKAKIAANSLMSLLKTSLTEDTNFHLLDVIPMATLASLLVDIISCIDRIDKSIDELASLAKFKTNIEVKPKKNQPKLKNQTSLMISSHHVITINQQE